jgi:hypothetical protein
MTWWPFKLQGNEKFWNALLAGNSVQVPITLTLVLLYNTTGIPEFLPTTEILIAQVGIFWGSLWSAMGAYTATNSEPTNISVPAIPDPNPEEVK